jgi:large conductance mechanosensitive channel
MFKEFKEFAIKGNAIDMAVGIIIGAAFGAIVSSLVRDVIMPPVGFLTGGVDFSNYYTVLKAGKDGFTHYASLKAAQESGAITINWGLFANNVINFVIVALSVFLLVRIIQRLKRPTPLSEPVSKDCPACQMTIPIKATRCPHCTTEFSTDAAHA